MYLVKNQKRRHLRFGLIHVLQGHDPAVPAEPADLSCRRVGGIPPLLRTLRVLPARSQVSLTLTQMTLRCQLMKRFFQCWGSVTFWSGSGSPDPYL
jgi:hypothetical protein